MQVMQQYIIWACVNKLGRLPSQIKGGKEGDQNQVSYSIKLIMAVELKGREGFGL